MEAKRRTMMSSAFAKRTLAIAVGFAMLAPSIYAQPAHAFEAVTPATGTTKVDESIRPFHVHVPQEQLDDLRRRIGGWFNRYLDRS